MATGKTSFDNFPHSVTEKVLDYCEKYSQNANLPKYFSGSSVQNLQLIDMPIERNDQNKNTINVTSVEVEPRLKFSSDKMSGGSKDKNICFPKKMNDINSDKNCLNTKLYCKSLLQSPSDNKKFELDNGPDIVYHNIERPVLCKSMSLPILINLNDSKYKLHTPSHFNTDSGADIVKVICPHSDLFSDESLNQKSQSDAQSSSFVSRIKTNQEFLNNSESEESKLLNFKKTLSYLKEQIGLPVAHSTPNIQDINYIPEVKRTMSSTNNNLNENDFGEKLSYKELKSVSDRLDNTNLDNISCPCVMTTGDTIQEIYKPIFSKSGPESGQVSLTNSEENKIIPNPVLNQPNKKVIELTISKPINIDWTNSDTLVEKCDVEFSLKSEAVPKKAIFLQLKSKEALNTTYKYIPTFYSKTKNVDIPKDYSNCSSNCDSFEYIDNVVDNKSIRNQKTQQESQNKNDLLVTGNQNHLNLLGADNPQHKDSCFSSSGSKSFSEDIEKQINLLQELLKSKGIHLNKKKYMKNIFESISDDEHTVEHSGSVTCGSNNDTPITDCTGPSKRLSRRSSHSTIGKDTTSSFEASSTKIKEDNVQSQSLTENQGKPDYLLQFAENERAYQINWIDNEISHLTKLKTILEVKNCKKYTRKAQTSFQRRPLNTSIYKVMQQDSNSTKSEREYVIETKLDISPSKQFNYCFQGKKYSITDCRVPITNTNSSGKFSEKCVSADVEIQSEDNRTNITVAPCFCKQKACYSGLDMSRKHSLGSNARKQSTYEKIPETVSKICSVCQQLKCICQEERNRPLQPSSGSNFPEYFNSLQKIFQKCSCTIENKTCNCLFVKKLFNHLLSNNDKLSKVSSSSSDVKTYSNFTTNSISSSGNKHKEKRIKNKFEMNGDKTSDTNKDTALKPSSDLQLELSENDRATQVLTPTSVEGIPTYNEHKDIGVLGYLTSVGLKDYGSQASDLNHHQKYQEQDSALYEDKRNNIEEKLSIQHNVTNYKLPLSDLQLEMPENDRATQILTPTSVERLPTHSEHKDIGVQASAGLKDYDSQTSDRNLHQKYQEQDSALYEDKRNNVEKKLSMQHNVTNYKLPSSDLQLELSENDRANQILTPTSVERLPTYSEHKDIGVQASVGLNDYGSQTSDRNLHQKYQEQESASYEDKRNNVEEKLIIQHNVTNDKLAKQKELYNDVSKIMTPGHSEIGNTIISKKDVTSNGSANYSQKGSTSENSSTSMFHSRTVHSSRLTCACCNKKTFVAEVCYIQNGNALHAVCGRCYSNTHKPFHNVCDLHHRHIMCLKWLDDGHTSKRYQMCKCKCKLKGSVIPQGVAYSLTLEEPPTKKKNTQFTKESIKYFSSDNGTNENNKENYYKTKNIQHVDPFNNQREKKTFENSDMSHREEVKGNEPHYTLTDYLIMNRPTFIYSAENRRQSVLNSRILREHQKDNLKLHFLENNMNHITGKDQYKLFTEREMRNITKKNYQQLPETQKKLAGLREKRLRDADKLIRNIFAKKVQKSALKGQWNFPIDKTVTDLKK